jgi:putative oxidoreductase
MKYFILTCRILLGLLFFIFGLNNILHFMKMAPMPGDAGVWMGIMAAHGWMTFVGTIMVVSGVLLLVGRFVPLALVLLAPVLVNILLFHALLSPHGFIPGVIATLLEIILLIAYHRSFMPLFVPDPKPDTPKI